MVPHGGGHRPEPPRRRRGRKNGVSRRRDRLSSDAGLVVRLPAPSVLEWRGPEATHAEARSPLVLLPASGLDRSRREPRRRTPTVRGPARIRRLHRVRGATLETVMCGAHHARAVPSVSVVIPTMNEEASIGRVLDEVRTALAGWDYEVLIVDTA